MNPRFAPTGGIGLTLSWDPSELPRMWQWRMLGPGMYLTGLEPANCGVGGRAQDRADGVLRVLEPGQTEALAVEIGVLPDEEAMEGR